MRTLGRSDRVDLPALGLYNIQAKIDTGAYSCSLHCQLAEVVDNQLEFILLDEEHPEFTGMKFVLPEYKERDVRNSFGIMERRYVICTPLIIFGENLEAEFTLSDRDTMRFPVLLGRKILRKRFVIDVTRRNLSYRHKKKKGMN